MNWKKAFKKGNLIVLATIDEKNKPHANIIASLGFVDGKILVANSQMQTTIKNLQKSKAACLISMNDNLYIRAKGKVEIFDSGKYFEICLKADKEYPPRHAILIKPTEVFDLDKVKPIKQ